MSSKAETAVGTVDLRLDGHERECALRYEFIERRLDEGSKKFLRIEKMLWGLYGLVAVAVAYMKVV
jgi:hypothetical protein|tara:strand:- start:165 stop:362 length:198 start_codon:yes stop_codon:yes gene_type:complete